MPQNKVLTLWNDEGENEKDTSILRKKSVELPVPLDKESRKIIQILIDSFLERDDAVGLAAPQIGINKRIVVSSKQTNRIGIVPTLTVKKI